MPEMPEVQGLVDFLRGRVAGLDVERATAASIAALKTYDPPFTSLVGATVVGAARHGKFIDLTLLGSDGPIHFVFHLAKAGWLRFTDELSSAIIKPGKTPIAARVGFEDGSGFDLTEAGTKKSLAIYVVRDITDVPGIASLGPDPLSDDFTPAVFAALLAGRRTQIKGLLRDQSILAGIGNAYSDEILHVAHLSPYATAGNLTANEVTTLYAATQSTLRGAIAEASGKPPAELKDAKRGGMRVHGRGGEPCPECGDVVRSVFFADRSLQYCARCQTGGKILADRRLSRLLK